MLTAIHLNDKIDLSTCEIRKIRTNRKLPNKLMAIQSPTTQFTPKDFFCGIVHFPKHAGSRGLLSIGSTHGAAPHPTLRATFSP